LKKSDAQVRQMQISNNNRLLQSTQFFLSDKLNTKTIIIRLFARDFYEGLIEVIVDSGIINNHFIEISGS